MSKEFPNIVSVKALENYNLFLTFDDGVEGQIDLSSIKRKGIMKYWNDEANFKKVLVVDSILVWNNEIDIDSNALYLQLIDKSFFEYARDM